MENIELFDELDALDSTAFPVSEEEQKLRNADKPVNKEKQVSKNTIEINLPEEVETEEDEEEVEDDSPEITDDKSDEEEITDEEKELLEQVESLKNMGALYLPDDYEVESLEKALADSEMYRNNTAVKSVFNKIPDVEIPGLGNAKDLFAYMFEYGGEDLSKFKKTFGNDSFDPAKFDLQKEEDRRKVLQEFYTKKGFNEVKANKLVDKIFDDLEDEAEATEALGELVKLSQQDKAAHLAELNKKREEKLQKAQEAYDNQVTIINSKDVLGGFPVSKSEKEKVLNSLYTKVSVEGKEMSDFDYRLQNVVLKNPELTLALSAFLNTLSQDNKGSVFFDLSKFERKEKTKAVKSLKEEVARVTSGRRKLTSSADETISKGKPFDWDSVVDYSDLT